MIDEAAHILCNELRSILHTIGVSKETPCLYVDEEGDLTFRHKSFGGPQADFYTSLGSERIQTRKHDVWTQHEYARDKDGCLIKDEQGKPVYKKELCVKQKEFNRLRNYNKWYEHVYANKVIL